MNTFDWKKDYRATGEAKPFRSRKPVIGITGNFGDTGCALAEGYYRSVLEAGGVPLVIPPFEDVETIQSLLQDVDGLLLSGGGDINPLYLGEEPVRELHGINPKRDKAELLLTRLAFDRQIPMMGICRGIQMLAAALDGSVYQDIYSQAIEGQQTEALGRCGKLLKHSQDLERTVASHTVRLTEGSLIQSIFGGEQTLAVNSFHHQAVKDAGPHFRVSARSTDGIIEAIESSEGRAILGVQWHPECFILGGNEVMMPLFHWLVDEADTFRRAKDFHKTHLTLDSHCDTPMFFGEGIHFGQRDPKILMDLHKMDEGMLDACIMVAYLKQEARDEASHQLAIQKADDILARIKKMVKENEDYVGIAHTSEEAWSLKHQGRHSIFLGIENGYAIGHDIDLVNHFRNEGVVYMTLCHNGDNDICDSARGSGEHGGLSAFGCEVVARMNHQGMMVDLSHASEKTFYDVLDVSVSPVVCSHSSAKILCDVPRNLTDEQMRVLAQKGGVAQVNFYKGFLKKDGEASIYDAVEHLIHMSRVMGVEHVGIGSDFDGDGGVPGLDSASEMLNFTRHLLKHTFSEQDLEGIWGGNFLRVMTEVQKKQF